jgi:hypothetical protein
MDWHHSNTRRGAAGLVFNRVIATRLGKKKDIKAGDDAEILLIAALKVALSLDTRPWRWWTSN